MNVDVVIVGLHLRWNGVYQRPQHLLSRIARLVPVIVVEEPHAAGTMLPKWIDDGNVTVVRPYVDPAGPAADSIDERTIAAVRARSNGRQALIWLYTPMMIALADAFAQSPVVFDAMDELTQFAYADLRLGEREARLLERADLVFCGGPSLYRSRAGHARNVKLYASGVDAPYFEQARTLAPHPDLATATRPVFGYIGVIDERIDLELVAAIADARPDATVALIGPTAKIDAANLPQRPNIRYLGQRAYAELPALLAGIDVALMPFALNASTRSISPTKTLEYLAAGKPVISTAVPDVVEHYADIITIADGSAAFVAALARAAPADAARQAVADARTHAASWDAIAGAMVADLHALGITLGHP